MAQPPPSSSRASHTPQQRDDRSGPPAPRPPAGWPPGGRPGLGNELLTELVDRGSRLVTALRRAWRGEYPPPRRPLPTTVTYRRSPSRELLPDVLASLALRDLTLVESLLRLVEQAEAREENPEQLAFLYQIDHLATRMRRHGENLLVLAGHDTHNSQFEPVPLLDVVRAAISETTDYDRVQIGSMPNVRVAGLAADDASHLLAELLDNAATKSPRHAPILVSGHPGDGSVVVVVEDSGIGVPTDRLEELNARLDGPPVLDASVTRHMGLYVVSRLAHRHGIRVRMEARVGGGTVVYIAVPDRLTQPNPPTPARPSQAPATPRTPAGEPAGTSPPPAPRPSPPAAPSERQPATTAGGLPRRVPRSTLPQRATPISAPPPPAAATPPGSGSPSSAPVEDAPADRLGADAARRIHDELDAFQTGQNAALRDVAASGGREDDQPEQ